MSEKYIKILSIDGGGIRGLIPALILKEIEKRCQKQIPIMFDLISGTSTGGIIALLLNKPGVNKYAQYSTKDVVDFYQGEDAKKIFSKKIIPFFSGGKFPSKNIENVLENRFENCLLNDSLTNVLITAYETETRTPVFFNNKNNRYKNLLMKDVARSTSAAPTYFDPYNFSTFTCLDGGLFANNPAMCSYVEILKENPNKKILIVSLGTGTHTKPLYYNKIKRWNPLQWGLNIYDLVSDGINDTIEYQLKKILSKEDYFRFQIPLPEKDMNMDNVSQENIEELITLTNKFIKNDFDKLIDELCLRICA